MRFPLYKTKKFIIFNLLILFFISCKNNTTNPGDNILKYSDSGKKALVIVVENNEIVGISDALTYSLYKIKIIPVLSIIFKVPEDELKDLSLLEVIKKYGEPWQINRISEAADGYYDKIIKLNNETATPKCFIDSLLYLKSSGYTIDVVLNMHASSNSLFFSDCEINISDLTDEIYKNKINIRAIYQTCCYAKYMLRNWKNIGVYAVNGAEGENVITSFSAAFFIKEWTSGKNFDEAVYSAYNMEIDTLKTFNNIAPIEENLLTQSNLQQSAQSIDGLNIKLLWKEIPLITTF
jgi:hypothetical protein